MRVVFMGQGRGGLFCLKRLLELGHSVQLVFAPLLSPRSVIEGFFEGAEKGAEEIGKISSPKGVLPYTRRALARWKASTFPARDDRRINYMARREGVEVLPSSAVKADEGRQRIERIQPDLLVASSFAHIVPEPLLELPLLGGINVHQGSLPEFRGAHTMFWALREGEHRFGCAVHYMEPEVDAGEVIVQDSMPVDEERIETGEIYTDMAELSADLLETALTRIEAGDVGGEEQSSRHARRFGFPGKEDVRLTLDMSYQEMQNVLLASRLIGHSAYVDLDGEEFEVGRVRRVEQLDQPDQYEPGSVVRVAEEELTVTCSDSVVALGGLAAADKNKSTSQFLAELEAGHHLRAK